MAQDSPGGRLHAADARSLVSLCDAPIACRRRSECILPVRSASWAAGLALSQI